MEGRLEGEVQDTPRAAPPIQAPPITMSTNPPPPPQTTRHHGFGTTERVSRPGLFAGFKEKMGPARKDPWLQSKFAVGILLALTVWSFYVVVGRVCTPMIRGDSVSGLGIGPGVGGMVGYIIVFLMYMWSYIRVLTVGPGYARDHVPKCGPPAPPPPPAWAAPPLPNPQVIEPESEHHVDIESMAASDSTQPNQQPMITHPIEGEVQHDPSALSAAVNHLPLTLQPSISHQPSSSATLAAQQPPKPEDDNNARTAKSGRKDPSDVQRPVPEIRIGPRWCRFCEINKPDRTHHCRHCGTCVMQFDHHCLWVGHCVGWRNHKYFMNFNFWGCLFNFYIMIFLICYSAKSSSDLDGEVIAAITVSAVFGLFTFMMFTSHLHLIINGKSTVESFGGREQQENEAAVLQKEYGYLWHNQEKRAVKKRWKEEWGGLNPDERWRWGSKTQMWEQEMGKSWVGWILPIGKPLGDGLHFDADPRFGPNGEWLRKKDWPKEVQS